MKIVVMTILIIMAIAFDMSAAHALGAQKGMPLLALILLCNLVMRSKLQMHPWWLLLGLPLDIAGSLPFGLVTISFLATGILIDILIERGGWRDERIHLLWIAALGSVLFFILQITCLGVLGSISKDVEVIHISQQLIGIALLQAAATGIICFMLYRPLDFVLHWISYDK